MMGSVSLEKANCVEGLTEALQTYEGFLEAMRVRRELGYGKPPLRLNEFIVFGTWYLDTCGNCMKRVDNARIGQDQRPEPKPPAIVMDAQEYWKWRKEAGLSESVKYCCESRLPPVRVVCPVCGRGWGLKTMMDVYVVNGAESVSLTPYAGMTVAQVKERFLQRSDGVWRLTKRGLRNDKYIGLTPKYPEPKHDWEKGIVANEYGWIEPADDLVIEEGDQGSLWHWQYYHNDCHYIELACDVQRRFEALFKDAGYPPVFLRTMSNGYGSEMWRGPWFHALTPWGVLGVGWRKRVIEITNQRGFRGLNMKELFASEDMTKGGGLVHAWGYDKAREYLEKIRLAVS